MKYFFIINFIIAVTVPLGEQNKSTSYVIFFYSCVLTYLIIDRILTEFKKRKFIKGLQKTKEKLKLSETCKNRSKSFSLRELILMEFAWFILLMLSVLTVVIVLFDKDVSPPSLPTFVFIPIMLFGCGIFCMLLFDTNYMIKIKIRNNNKKD